MTSQLTTLLWAKNRIARHHIASVRRESKLKVAFVSCSAFLLWLGGFWMARQALGWLDLLAEPVTRDAGEVLIDLVMNRLLATLSMVIFGMLIVSNVLIAYATLYRSREVPFLLRRPLPTATFFLGRFYECVTFSSWATAFLGSPVLLAYGLARDAPASFYLALIAFYIPFVVLPAAIGCGLTVVLVRIVAPRSPTVRWLMLGGLVAVLGALLGTAIEIPRFDDIISLPGLVDRLARSQSPFLPSAWLTTGVLAAAAGRLGDAVFHFLLLLANAAFFVWLATLVAERWFAPGWAALEGHEGQRRTPNRRYGILHRVDRLVAWLPEPRRALVRKDLRTFWRDPAQWSQFVLFFGILVLYVASLQRSSASYSQEPWRSWIALLNVGACLLVLATLTTRFMFPLISLEGRRFWILGLAPLTREQIVWQKFWLSVACTASITVSLAAFSAAQLQLDRFLFWLSVATVMGATTALSGLAVGLGSLYPNFEEDNPSRIVSGMGGTLNFILSLVYVVVVVAALAVVFLGSPLEALLGEHAQLLLRGGAVVVILVATAITARLPIALGIRNLMRAEL